MNTAEALKGSISSAEDLQSVTRTMKTLAAVNIRQYEAAADALQEYSRSVRVGLQMMLRRGVELSSSTAQISSRQGAVVFGSDQGMCGPFNEQVARFASELLNGHRAIQAPVVCVGHRAADALRELRVPVDQVFSLPGSADRITTLVHDLLPAIDHWRDTNDVARILVVHNRRQTASTWKPHASRLLPLHLRRLIHGERDDTSCLPFWTMDTDTLFSRLVRQFLFVSLFRACAESQAGENASRIAAMQSAAVSAVSADG